MYLPFAVMMSAASVGSARGLITFELPDSWLTHPHEEPDRRVMMAMVATVMAVIQVPLMMKATTGWIPCLLDSRWVSIQTRKGREIIAVALSAIAAPSRTKGDADEPDHHGFVVHATDEVEDHHGVGHADPLRPCGISAQMFGDFGDGPGDSDKARERHNFV